MSVDELNYPVDREMQVREEKGRSKYEVDLRLFRPRPTKDKEKADNKLFVLAFNFNNFQWFKNAPALRNFYLTLFLHQINEVSDSGTPQRRFVICEPSMNKYATDKLSDATRVVPPLFPGVNFCPFCKKSQDFWNKYKEQKKAAGIEGVTEERFKSMMDANPHIRATRELAIEWGAQEKFYFLVFDYSRFLGEAPPRSEDDDGSCAIQAYIGPQVLVERLYAKQRAKSRFWDFTGNNARTVILTRDNKFGARRCRYEVETEEGTPQLDGDTLSYLQNPPAEDLFDPAEFVRRLTVDEKKNYVSAYGSGSPVAQDQEDTSVFKTETDEETPQAEVQDITPPAAARPRARIAAPSVPPPAAAVQRPVEAQPVETPSAEEVPPAPSAEATPPKRAKVTWRK